jgi:hypothetical protein
MFDYHTMDAIRVMILGRKWKLGDPRRETAIQQERKALLADLIRRLWALAPKRH